MKLLSQKWEWNYCHRSGNENIITEWEWNYYHRNGNEIITEMGMKLLSQKLEWNYYHRNGNEIIITEMGMKLLSKKQNEIIITEMGMKLLPKVRTLSGSIHLVRYMYYKIISQTKRINLAFLIRYQNSSSNENGNCKRCAFTRVESLNMQETLTGT